jgi:protein gp37
MAETKISWAHYTMNPWSGCAKVSPACANCYAATLPPSMRRGAVWGADTARIPASESYWQGPIAWDRKAAKAGERHRVFCASTADVFEARPDLDEARLRLFKLIEATPNLDWLLLTKRPDHMAEWFRTRAGTRRR